MHQRKGLTLTEVIVVMAIIGIMIGLMIPAVQKVRAHALMTESMNNVRQISIATQNFASAHRNRLPNVDGKPPNWGKSLFSALLPYVEQENMAKLEADAAASPISTAPVVRTYVSPADPSLTDKWAACSYAANAQVFSLLFTPSPNLATTFPDGASNTIAFAEHYSACGPIGGAEYFFYHQTMPSTSLRRATFADVFGPRPNSQGNPPSTMPSFRPEDTFQVAPRLEHCSSGMAQTPHAKGMIAGFADGSIRILQADMAPIVYWSLVTPGGGEVVSLDF